MRFHKRRIDSRFIDGLKLHLLPLFGNKENGSINKRLIFGEKSCILNRLFPTKAFSTGLTDISVCAESGGGKGVLSILRKD